ncbi:polyketide cyclase [Actinomadura sp. NBRC 104425]|uniref:SRPBCC family protein n=1 Tax=Actinomadura sp. NBRC 104425 TaxID=3032204 RepID=UPI0024A3472F|nr:SRPBCC family protein [Actinomadura sp. NBRC 104425]GLZ12816.1 polyketide cyclase [Actinomadura sp. NBRC 104425]
MPTRSYASTVLSAPADEVWGFLRDFGNLADWMPGVATCAIEDGGPADRVGCVRRVIGPGDTVFRERLCGMDDDDRSYWYGMLESPLPIRDYVGRIRVAPVTDSGGSFVEWQGEFSVDAADEEAMRKTIATAIYHPALEALGKRFS